MRQNVGGIDRLRAFVGANLLQSGFTQFCLLETILVRLGVKPA